MTQLIDFRKDEIGKVPATYTNTIEQKLENYEPLHNFVLTETPFVPDSNGKGLYLDPKYRQDLANGNKMDESIALKVVKVGPEVVNVKPGDYVLTKGTPSIISLDGRMYTQYLESWLVGIFMSEPRELKKSPSLINNPA